MHPVCFLPSVLASIGVERWIDLQERHGGGIDEPPSFARGWGVMLVEMSIDMAAVKRGGGTRHSRLSFTKEGMAERVQTVAEAVESVDGNGRAGASPAMQQRSVKLRGIRHPLCIFDMGVGGIAAVLAIEEMREGWRHERECHVDGVMAGDVVICMSNALPGGTATVTALSMV
ncbi:hypothetical protein BD779DRAFT_1473049 [Infundibulicybe gibba]|nr:hypothetical protein BD779DRAFT_1473049 [Infundibulicybe gibba]